MLKLVIFDWDGTLANSINQIIQCKKTLAENYSLQSPKPEVVKKVLGLPFEKALKICFPKATDKQLDSLSRNFHALMQEETYQAKLFPGISSLLGSLKERGLKIAIATSKHRIELDRALLHNGLENTFDVTCAGDEYPGKPNPLMLKSIVDSANVSPKDSVVVGDSTTDIKFAQNAGIKIIAVSYGAGSLHDLALAKPDALVDTVLNLEEELANLC